jgi:hypothetical protein
MLPEVLVGLVVEAFDGCLFECSVHAFDLSVGPGGLGFGQPMVDVVASAGELPLCYREDVGASCAPTL